MGNQPSELIRPQSPVDEVKEVACECETQKEPVQTDGKILLFKTPTCPNCKAAMALLDKAGITYSPLNANEEKDLVEQYGIKQAPTLVVISESGYEKYRGVSDIKGWLMSK